MSELNINYQNTVELNITPNEGPTWEPFCDGWENLSESMNEELYQTSYLCSKGWGTTEVTGGQFTLSLTGARKIGDPVMDFIFGQDVKLNFGSARKTQLRLATGGEYMEWDVTLANITESRGDANQPNAVTVEIHANGAPRTYKDSEMLEALKVVSVAGASGKTKIYVNPVKEGANTYKYYTGPYVELPAYGDALSAWTAWNGSTEIDATDGEYIAIAELSGGETVKAGMAKVIAG